jgi:hypothetical protein
MPRVVDAYPIPRQPPRALNHCSTIPNREESARTHNAGRRGDLSLSKREIEPAAHREIATAPAQYVQADAYPSRASRLEP